MEVDIKLIKSTVLNVFHTIVLSITCVVRKSMYNARLANGDLIYKLFSIV